MHAEPSTWHVADPFDLPEWLGEQELTWRAESSIGGPHAAGVICGRERRLPLTVLGADTAYPQPVVSSSIRTAVHQAWTYSQVALLAATDSADAYAVAVPGTAMDVDLVCTALRRFAKSIGVDPTRISVLIRL